MKCKKSFRILLIIIIFFIILSFAQSEDIRKKIFLFVCLLGVFYFILKTIVIIIYETIKEKANLKKKYAIPVAAYTYMILSVFFIFKFICNIYNNNFPAKLTNFIDVPKGCLNDFFCSTVYLVIISFVWNFSKSFFTINALEYGVVGIEKKGIEAGCVAIIVDIIIRMISATCFILTEQHLYNFKFEEVDLLNQINLFAIFTIILYISLLVWFIYFHAILFKKKITNKKKVTDLINIILNKCRAQKINNKLGSNLIKIICDKWAIQFYLGLLLSFLLFYFGIGHLCNNFENNINALCGSILYAAPSLLMCCVIVYIEVEEFPKLIQEYFTKKCAN